MKRWNALLMLSVGLLNAPLTLAQAAGISNLSGTWKINVTKSKIPKAWKNGSDLLSIKQDGLQIEFRYDASGKTNVESYTADNKERVLLEVPRANSKIMAKAHWKGTTLITETKSVFDMSAPSPLAGSEIMNVKNSWTISSDGLVLTDKYQSDDGESRRVYDKQ